VNCGACHQGCRIGAKASTDTTYLPAAVADGAEIRPDSTVHSIERDHRGRVSAVIYRHAGRDVRQRCRALFVCAGGVETPRLLLHTDVATGSGHVGRNFLAHGAVQVWARYDEAMRTHRGYPSSIISEDFVRPTDADFVGGYLMQSLGVMPLTWATTLIRGAGLRGQQLVDMLHNYPHMAGIGINAECLPDENNRLTLSEQTDDLGVPLASVSYTMGSNERAIDEHATDTMLSIVQAAGGRDPIVLPRTAHTIGTARMGTTPDNSVVDSNGRAWDVPNLYICDNSVFPSALSANPALLTMALGLRTAARFVASGKR
jgi:choline dehydrogenase-like flavoprotein